MILQAIFCSSRLPDGCLFFDSIAVGTKKSGYVMLLFQLYADTISVILSGFYYMWSLVPLDFILLCYTISARVVSVLCQKQQHSSIYLRFLRTLINFRIIYPVGGR